MHFVLRNRIYKSVFEEGFSRNNDKYARLERAVGEKKEKKMKRVEEEEEEIASKVYSLFFFESIFTVAVSRLFAKLAIIDSTTSIFQKERKKNNEVCTYVEGKK